MEDNENGRSRRENFSIDMKVSLFFKDKKRTSTIYADSLHQRTKNVLLNSYYLCESEFGKNEFQHKEKGKEKENHNHIFCMAIIKKKKEKRKNP